MPEIGDIVVVEESIVAGTPVLQKHQARIASISNDDVVLDVFGIGGELSRLSTKVSALEPGSTVGTWKVAAPVVKFGVSQ